jgi:hypothetical protein
MKMMSAKYLVLEKHSLASSGRGHAACQAVAAILILMCPYLPMWTVVDAREDSNMNLLSFRICENLSA